MQTREYTSKDNNVKNLFGEKASSKVVEANFSGLADLKTMKKSRLEKRGGLRHWYGTHSIENLERLCEEGWPEALAAMESRMGELDIPDIDVSINTRRKRKKLRGDFGNEVDIHAVRQGRGDTAWTRMQHVSVDSPQRKLVHVFVNLCCSAMIDAEDQLWRAAVALRVCEGLEKLGKSVAITVGFVSANPFVGERSTLYVTSEVKSYGQQVTRERLAAMFSAGFWRLYLMERGVYCVPGKTPTHNCGTVVDSPFAIPIALKQERENGTHVVTVGQAFDRTMAIKQTRKIFEQIMDKEARPEGFYLSDVEKFR